MDDPARRTLARLARATTRDESPPGDCESVRQGSATEPSYRRTIERATTALQDVESAVQFVEDVGLEELEAAVESARRSVSASAADGRAALEAYREFRAAAAGDQFRSGRGTSIGGDDVADGT